MDVHPVNLTKKPKKKESKSKKEEFKLDEEMVKNEDDQKIIAVKVPENIKNFGKSKFPTNGRVITHNSKVTGGVQETFSDQ